MAVENALEITDLHKSYGKLRVLRGVDLVVIRGEAFGLLGPNGAGKSTLIHSILGLLLPDKGAVKVLGAASIEQVAGRIGYLPERPRYHTQFTGREYLGLLGQLSDLTGLKLHERIDTVFELVDMQDAADRRVGTYSKGMLQRLGLAQALLHEPDVLIVDEPGSGLDPAGQRDMAELIQRIRETGRTVFMCTHHLSEVTQLCDRVGVLTQGRLQQVVSLEELRNRGHSVTIKVADLPAQTGRALETIGSQVTFTRTEVTIYPVTNTLQSRVLRALLDDEVRIISVTPEADALEQFYLKAIRENEPQSDVPRVVVRESVAKQPQAQQHDDRTPDEWKPSEQASSEWKANDRTPDEWKPEERIADSWRTNDRTPDDWRAPDRTPDDWQASDRTPDEWRRQEAQTQSFIPPPTKIEEPAEDIIMNREDR